MDVMEVKVGTVEGGSKTDKGKEKEEEEEESSLSSKLERSLKELNNGREGSRQGDENGEM